MNKIGVLTVFRTGNYGATLQAYATLEAINRNGFGEAELINYCCNSIRGKIDLAFIRKVGLFRAAVTMAEKIYYHPRMRKVKSFITSMAPGKELKREDLPGLNDRYDIFLSGSDQLWNPDIQLEDHSYLLDFVADGVKKRSYASSFGVATLPEGYAERCGELLRQYHGISVREEAALKLVKDLTGRDVPVVLDPTMLLSPAEWAEKLPQKHFRKKNVFVYQMAHSALLPRVAAAARKHYGAKLRYVPFPIGGICRCRPTLSLSSFEWIAAIRDSSFVVTDSFHGVVFAILMRRNFYYVITSETVKKRLSRLTTLLGALGLENRLLENMEDCDFSNEIDYDEVHHRLACKRQESLAILKELLQ